MFVGWEGTSNCSIASSDCGVGSCLPYYSTRLFQSTIIRTIGSFYFSFGSSDISTYHPDMYLYLGIYPISTCTRCHSYSNDAQPSILVGLPVDVLKDPKMSSPTIFAHTGYQSITFAIDWIAIGGLCRLYLYLLFAFFNGSWPYKKWRQQQHR